MTKIKKKELIRLFKKAQAIPYFLLKHRDSQKLFSIKKGSCAEKTIWLGNKLKEKNIPVKYYLIKFDWNDLPVPKEIIKLKKKEPGYHLALRSKVGRKWIWIDSTWDLGLEKGGFPVTKNWDGKTNTKLAVKTLNIREFEPEDPSTAKLENKFIAAFNKYLEKIRKNRV